MAKKFKEGQKVYVATHDGLFEATYCRVEPYYNGIVVRQGSTGTSWERRCNVFATRTAAERRCVWLSVQRAKGLRQRAAQCFKTFALPDLKRAAKYDPEGAMPDWLLALEGDANLTGHPHLAAAVKFCKKHLGVK